MPNKCCTQTWFPDRCTIQQDSRAAGSPEPNYTTYKTKIPCRVIPTSGDETFRGRQLEGHIDYVVEMRFFRGVVNTMRLLMTTGIYKDRILNIAYVTPMQKQGAPPQLMLKCREAPTQI